MIQAVVPVRSPQGRQPSRAIGSRSIVRTWRVRPASVRTSAAGMTPDGQLLDHRGLAGVEPATRDPDPVPDRQSGPAAAGIEVDRRHRRDGRMARDPLRRAGLASCRFSPGGRRSCACVSPQWLRPSLGRDVGCAARGDATSGRQRRGRPMSRIVTGPWSTHPTSTIQVRCPSGSRAASVASRRSRSCSCSSPRWSFLALVSGRGEVTVKPVAVSDRGRDRDDRPRGSRVVDAAGRLTTMDADGGSVVRYGQAGVTYRFPAWSPDGTRIAAIATTPTGNAVHVFAVPKPGVGGSSSAVPTAIDPTSRLRGGRGWTVLRLLGAGQHHPHVPDDRTGRHRAATWIGRRHAAGAHRARGDAALLGLVGQRPDARAQRRRRPGAFLGEVARDGSTAADLGVQPGDFRAPARSRRRPVPRLHRARHGHAGARGRRRQRRVRPSRGRRCSAEVSSASGPTATSWPSSRRPRRARRSRSRSDRSGSSTPARGPSGPCSRATSSPSSGRPTDGPSLRSGSGHRTTRSRWRAARGLRATAPGLALDLLFVDAASGSVRSRTPVRLADTFAAQVLPFFDQYALSHRLWAPDSSAIVAPARRRRRDDRVVDHPAGRLGRAADRRRRHRLLEPLRLDRLVHTSCAHYLCKYFCGC